MKSVLLGELSMVLLSPRSSGLDLALHLLNSTALLGQIKDTLE